MSDGEKIITSFLKELLLKLTLKEIQTFIKFILKV